MSVISTKNTKINKSKNVKYYSNLSIKDLEKDIMRMNISTLQDLLII